MTSHEQAKDLLDKLRAAKKALESTGAVTFRGESLAPAQYTESEVEGRFTGAWWALSMMINDVTTMYKQWKDEKVYEKQFLVGSRARIKQCLSKT